MSASLRVIFRIALLGIAGVAMAAPAVTVSFAPPVARALAAVYGNEERAPLAEAVLQTMRRAAAHLPPGSSIQVTFDELAPTRLTRRQLDADPSIDPVRSKLLGGAGLRAVVRDPHDRVLTQVAYRYFPPTLHQGSLQRDSWADARLAIEGLGSRLSAACAALPRAAIPPG